MADYEKLYHIIFNAVTDALEQIVKGNIEAAITLLISAQQKTEELYIEQAEQ